MIHGAYHPEREEIFGAGGERPMEAARQYWDSCTIRGAWGVGLAGLTPFWAASLEHTRPDACEVTLHGVILNTSQVVEGIQVTKQLTYLPQMRLIGASIWAVPCDGTKMMRDGESGGGQRSNLDLSQVRNRG